MSTMRTAQVLLTLTLLAGCAGGDTAADSAAAAESAAAAAAAATPAAPARTVADFAGTWQTSATLTGVANPVPSTLTINADGTASMTLEGRQNIAVTTSISGDSLVTESAEYESVLRKGVMVTTRTAAVMSGNTMNGTIVATYKTPAGPEVVNGTITGTKNP
jgi:hypothetical protein